MRAILRNSVIKHKPFNLSQNQKGVGFLCPVFLKTNFPMKNENKTHQLLQ